MHFIVAREKSGFGITVNYRCFESKISNGCSIVIGGTQTPPQVASNRSKAVLLAANNKTKLMIPWEILDKGVYTVYPRITLKCKS